MARPAKPWYRQGRDAWYVEVDGRQVLLAQGRENETAARDAWHKMMAARGESGPAPAVASLNVAMLIVGFLKDRERKMDAGELAPSTYHETYLPKLSRFARDLGTMDAATIRPMDVEAWMDRQGRWGPTTRRDAATVVKAAFRWAHQRGMIPTDPVAALKKPKARRREVHVGSDRIDAVLAAVVSPLFRDLLLAMYWTGARPGEICRLEARYVDVEAGIVVMPGKTTAATGEPRRIRLSEEASTLLAEKCELFPVGPLFRNHRGGAWTRNAINCQVRAMRKRGEGLSDVVAYALRHGFATDALVNGTPIAEVAELMGHRTTAMLMRNYSHLGEKHEYLKRSLGKFRD